jgi:palmitoyl-protein thioesterase
MGVSAFPHCESGLLCYPINFLTKSMVYTEFVQNNIGPAGYFRDVNHLTSYLAKSHFLPDLNNERFPKASRKERVYIYIKYKLIVLKFRWFDASKIYGGYYDTSKRNSLVPIME